MRFAVPGSECRRRRATSFILVVAVLASVLTAVPMQPAAAGPGVWTGDREPLPREATVSVGALPGSHTVTNNGQAVYDVPIEAPPGIAGVVPNIGLRSAPGAGDGRMGLGWGVTGLSRIQRCPLGHAQGDGWAQPTRGPGSPGAAAYCLDGRLLVSVTSEYGGDGTEYRTEIESFSRVISRGSGGEASGGPQGFEVYTSSGRLLRFGFTADSVVDANGVRTGWLLSREQDRSGNHLDITYARTCRLPLDPPCSGPAPVEISYGGHLRETGGNQPHDRSIQFRYDELPDGRVSYVRGIGATETRRLAEVDTVVRGAVVRRYRIGYVKDGDISRVQRIGTCVDENGKEVCLPPTSFTYTDAEPLATTPVQGPVTSAAFGNGPFSGTLGRTIVLDANGDGRDDLLYPQPTSRVHCRGNNACYGNWRYRLAVATGLRTSPYRVVDPMITGDTQFGNGMAHPYWCLTQAGVVDVNVDGKDDLVDTCDGGPESKTKPETHIGTVLLSTGEAFTARPDGLFGSVDAPKLLAEGSPLTVADLDGDGRKDIVRCYDDGRSVLYLHRAPGERIDPEGTALPTLSTVAWGPWGRRAGPCTSSLLVDMDGDGAVNLMRRLWTYLGDPVRDVQRWRQEWKYLQVGPDGRNMWRDTGLSWTDDYPENPGSLDYYRPPYKVDENALFRTGSDYADREQMRVLDANGDGLSDVMRLAAGQVTLYLGTGAGFTGSDPFLGGRPEWSWYAVTPTAFARADVHDADGDGRDDVLLPVGNTGTGEPPRWVLHRAGAAPQLVGTWPLDKGASPLRADVDGDGSLDIVLNTPEPESTDEVGNTTARMAVLYSTQARASLLRTVYDGLGRTVRFDYDPGTGATAVYRRTTQCTDGHSRCLNRLGPLVSSVTESAAMRLDGEPAEMPIPHRVTRSKFLYKDARVGRYGRGYLGVGWRREIVFGADDDDGIRTVIRTFGNAEHVEQLAGTSARHWFPDAGRVVREETTADGVQQGFDTPRKGAMSTVTTVKPGRRVSFNGRPFTIEEERTSEAAFLGEDATRTSITGQTTMLAVDLDGNPVRSETVRRAGGRETGRATVITTYDQSRQRRERWQLGLPTRRTETDVRGGTAQTRTTAYDHDVRGIRTRTVQEPDGALPLRLQTDTMPDVYGNPVRVTVSAPGVSGLQPRVTAADYDDRGLFPVAVTNAEGHVSTVVTDPALGLPLVEIDPNGIVTRTAYDGLGRQVRRRSAVGDTVIRYERADTDDGHPAARMRVTQAMQGGATTVVDTDALGRTVLDGTTGYGGAMLWSTTGYDDRGNLATVERPHRDRDDSQGVIRYEHDGLGRLVSQARPDDDAAGNSAVTAYRYGSPQDVPGNESWQEQVRAAAATAVEVRDPRGHRVVQVRDGADDLAARVEPGGATTQFRRGPFGALLQLTDPGGATTAFQDDGYGHTTLVDSPDAGRHTYTWTPFGEVRTHVDAKLRTTAFDSDRLGRTVRRTDDDGTATWQYDGPGPNTIGRLTQSTARKGYSTRFEYEDRPADSPNRGLLAATVHTIAKSDFRTGFGHDRFGRLDRTEYPEAGRPFVVNRSYDSVGNLTEVYSASGVPFWRFLDSTDGQRVSEERLGASLALRHRHQPLSGRLEGTTTKLGSRPLQNISYSYLPGGALQAQNDAERPISSQMYEYDDSNRLTALPAHPGNPLGDGKKTMEAFGYGDDGRITRQDGVGDYGYGQRPHAVTSAGRNTYEYDANGRQTARRGPDIPGGWQHVDWTAAGLPAQVVTRSTDDTAEAPTYAAASYRYDAEGARVLRFGADGVTTYVSDLYEWNVNPYTETTQHRYIVRVAGRVVADVVREQKLDDDAVMGTDQVNYVLPDRFGSVRATVDAQGNPTYRNGYTAFGRPDTPGQGRKVTGGRGFAGHHQEEELGLVEAGARLYDPTLGRFLSPDPVLTDVGPAGEPPQLLADRVDVVAGASAGHPTLAAGDLLDPYAYAGNNPVSFGDPDGREPSPAGSSSQPFTDRVLDALVAYNQGLLEGFTPLGSLYNPSTGTLDTREKEFFRGAGEATAGLIQMVVGGAGTGVGGAITGVGLGLGPLAVPVSAAGTAITVASATVAGNGAAVTGNGLVRAGLNVNFSVSTTPGGGPAGTGSGPAAASAAAAGNGGDLPEGQTASPSLRGDPYHPDSVAARSGKNQDLYGPSLVDRAFVLGYMQRIPAQKAPFDSHGQSVFFNGKNYITRDIDGHNVTDGWKMFNRNGQRMGTFDSDLNYLKD